MTSTDRIERSDEDWKQSLTPEQFQVTRCGGTERAFTGAYWDNKATGMYHCIAAGRLCSVPRPNSSPERVGPASGMGPPQTRSPPSVI